MQPICSSVCGQRYTGTLTPRLTTQRNKASHSPSPVWSEIHSHLVWQPSATKPATHSHPCGQRYTHTSSGNPFSTKPATHPHLCGQRYTHTSPDNPAQQSQPLTLTLCGQRYTHTSSGNPFSTKPASLTTRHAMRPLRSALREDVATVLSIITVRL
jgi:hypothetical protein